MEADSRFGLLRLASRRIATVIVASHLMVASTAVASPTTDVTPPNTVAKWAPRTIHFMYSAVPSSTTTYYSCDRLQERIAAILRQLGAREAAIKPFGCFTNGGPEKFPGVDATFTVLEPVERDDHSESAKVEAHWRKVTFNSEDSCALMEQVKRRILPLFATRNQSSGCSPFSVEVLQPVKTSKPAS